MKVIYLVYDHGIDGRAIPQLLASFETRGGAESFYDSTYHTISTTYLYKDKQDFEDNNPEVLKKKALAKLSVKERELLGLSHYKL